jgi:eight-cysteine-cluster-containing protein
VLSIDSCDYNPAVSALTEHDREFLEQRQVCCGDACTCADGTAPVNCFADPCSVAPACSEGTCQANYCGGCNAEFYDENGYAVCENPSPAEPTCPANCHPTGCSGQICAAEDVITTCEFRPEYACYQDPTITQCGCVAGGCGWAQTDELAKCLAAAGGI